jgi:type I restriction enzyme S subunit
MQYVTGATRLKLTQDDMLRAQVYMRTSESQQAVADYLDTETARIDALIAKKRRMIELLDERWRACASSYLADGKPCRLKHLLRRRPSYGVLVPRFAETGVPFIRVNNLDRLASTDVNTLPMIDTALATEYRRTMLNGGEVLISVVGTMGKAGVVPNRLRGANIARAVCRLDATDTWDAHLIRLWVTSTDLFLDQAKLSVGGDTAQPTLNVGDLVSFKIAVPQDDRVRRQVAAVLLKKEEQWATTRGTILHQIDLLAEHRQALITAAVTGELDVAKVA